MGSTEIHAGETQNEMRSSSDYKLDMWVWMQSGAADSSIFWFPDISHRSSKQECKHFCIQECFHHICIYTAWERMDDRFTREAERESTYPEANPFYLCVCVCVCVCVCNRSFFNCFHFGYQQLISSLPQIDLLYTHGELDHTLCHLFSVA